MQGWSQAAAAPKEKGRPNERWGKVGRREAGAQPRPFPLPSSSGPAGSPWWPGRGRSSHRPLPHHAQPGTETPGMNQGRGNLRWLHAARTPPSAPQATGRAGRHVPQPPLLGLSRPLRGPTSCATSNTSIQEKRGPCMRMDVTERMFLSLLPQVHMLKPQAPV